MNDPHPSPFDALNRRGFIKTSSTAVIGSSLLGLTSLNIRTRAAQEDMLKIVLIGCGGRGSGAANQALNAAGNAKLIAMADVFPDRLQSSLAALKKAHPDKIEVPEDQQFIGFDAYLKALPLADVVILATPPGFRPTHFEAAVNAGKHIFMEKPVATDAPGIRKVLAAAQVAKQKNLKVAVGLQRHHQPGYIETIQRLHDGAIGDLVSMRCYWDSQRPWLKAREAGESEMHFQMRNWYYFTWICGDHIVEQHVHNIDVINWMKNAYPVKAYGMGGCQAPRNSNEGEIFDHHAVEFEYADGSRLNSQCRHIKGCWDSVSEHARGLKGTVDTADGGAFVIKDNSGKVKWKYEGKQKEPAWQLEHYPFFEAVRKDKPYNEAEYGAKSTMTAIMGRMSTYSGKEITWDEALNSPLVLAPDNISWDAVPKSQPGPDGLYPMAIPGNPDWLKKIL